VALVAGTILTLDTSAATYGLTGVVPVWNQNQPPNKITGIRYKFRVAELNGGGILFCCNRLSPTDSFDSSGYLIEANLYDYCLYYDDWAVTTWPLVGSYRAGETSVRIAAPDWANAGMVGTRTMSPSMFPRQTYLIDGLENVWKTDMISQADLVGKDCEVEIIRGPLISDLSGWRHDGPLPEGSYRRWDARVAIESAIHEMAFAFPEADARYLCNGEVFNFATEYWHVPGDFRIYLWDMDYQVQGETEWRSVLNWRAGRHDGSLDDFGIRMVDYQDHSVIEFGTRDNAGYSPTGTVFYIGETPAITNVVVTDNKCQLDLRLPTDHFEGINGFIVERFLDLGQKSECVASSAILTNRIEFDTKDTAQAFYRCQFDLHVVELPIPDTNLASAVTEAISPKAQPTNALYDIDLKGIGSLGAGGRGIETLTGIGSVPNLRSVDLGANLITDAGPLGDLAQLSFLVLHDNQVSDVSALGKIASLRELHMWNNGVTDAAALASLTNLQALHLGWNGVGDLTFVAGMTNLWYLAIWQNDLSEVGPLSGLPNLSQLYLGGNAIEDILPLVGLTNLTRLDLVSNRITNLEPLLDNAAAGGLGPGDEVWVSGNPLSNEIQVTELRETYGVTVNWP